MNKATRLVTVMLALGVAYAWGQHQPVVKQRQPVRAARTLTTEGSISVVFVPVPGGPSLTATPSGQGTLQLGEVSAGTGARTTGVFVERRPASMVVRSMFGMRLDNPGAPQGSATLSAFLFHVDGRCDIFVDGVKLGITSRMIQRSQRYGLVTPHRLEIEVPSSVPDTQGDIANNIGFLAVPN